MKNKKLKSTLDFPDASLALEHGLIAVGGDLDVGTLYHAYKRGIFPWPQPDYPMLWFSPDRRGVLDFAEIHIPKSLQKSMRKELLKFTVNRNFKEVIDACQSQRRKFQKGTWIIPELREAYVRFHEAGFAHSVECWKESELVGGIYGVLVEGVFSGESMFHRIPNASKYSLLYLIEYLKSLGLKWMDIQMVTSVTEQLGGKYISREEFLSRLDRVHAAL